MSLAGGASEGRGERGFDPPFGSCFLTGARTINMLRPSTRGAASTLPTSLTCSAIRSKDLLAQLRMGHLPPPEHDRDLDLRALVEEPLHVFGLRGVVVLVDLGTELHLLDHDIAGLAPRFLPPHVLLVLVLPEVHDLADGGVGVRRDLHQVEVVFTSDVERFGQRLDSDLLSVGSDQAYFSGPDPLVDPGIGCGNRRITLSVGGLDPGTRKRRRRCAVRRSPGYRLSCQPDAPRSVAGWEVANSCSTPIFPVSCRA